MSEEDGNEVLYNIDPTTFQNIEHAQSELNGALEAIARWKKVRTEVKSKAAVELDEWLTFNKMHSPPPFSQLEDYI